MDGSALAAARLCFPSGGKEQCWGVGSPWGNAGVERRLPGVTPISQVAFQGAHKSFPSGHRGAVPEGGLHP